MPWRGACLRSDSRATAMVTAAASRARPATWTPISRPSSGNWADTFATRHRCGAGRATGDGAALGCGVTSGNETPGGLEPATGPGRPPSMGEEPLPTATPRPGGSAAPTPEMGDIPLEFEVPDPGEPTPEPEPGEPDDGLGEGVVFPATMMVSMLDGAEGSGGSIAVVTVKLRCCPAVAVRGIGTVACTRTGASPGDMAPSEQVAVAAPVVQSFVNCGVIPLVSGLSVTETPLAAGLDGGAELGQTVGLALVPAGELEEGAGEGHRLASQTSML